MGGEKDRNRWTNGGQTQDRGSNKNETVSERQGEIKGNKSESERQGDCHGERERQARTGRYHDREEAGKGKTTKKERLRPWAHRGGEGRGGELPLTPPLPRR